MEKETIIRFLKCEATRQEEEAVLDWIEESPANRAEMERIDLMFNGVTLYDRNSASGKVAGTGRRIWRAVARYGAAAAVAGIIVLAGGHFYEERAADRLAMEMMKVEVPAGQRISLTLVDGTEVWLNSGTTLEYPAAFGKKERRVRLEGEANFEVAPEEGRPFIVSAHRCDVKVLGTNFNIISDSAKDRFRTSLLRGKVQVSLRDGGKSVMLSPQQTVSFVDGDLVVSKIENYDEFLWRDGIVSLRCDSFLELMDRLGNEFGVDINVEDGFDPAVKVNGKVRVSDGIVHALDVLRQYVGFTYEYKSGEDAISVRRL